MRHITLIIAVLALALAAPAFSGKGGVPNGGNGNEGGRVMDSTANEQDASPARAETSGSGSGKTDSGKSMGTISVTGDETLGPTSTGMSSDFTASGCGFKAGSDDYFLVVRGPGIGTSLAYWYDGFRTDAGGCGSRSPSWAGSGVAGDFDVYVVFSGSGQPWKGQVASNVVTVTITDP